MAYNARQQLRAHTLQQPPLQQSLAPTCGCTIVHSNTHLNPAKHKAGNTLCASQHQQPAAPCPHLQLHAQPPRCGLQPGQLVQAAHGQHSALGAAPPRAPRPAAPPDNDEARGVLAVISHATMFRVIPSFPAPLQRLARPSAAGARAMPAALVARKRCSGTAFTLLALLPDQAFRLCHAEQAAQLSTTACE